MNIKMFLMKLLFLATTIIYFSGFEFLQAQDDPTKEILVYFKSGVERTQKDQPALVKSTATKGILVRLKIDENKITSAFPDFDEADTLKNTADGQFICLPNMAKIFRIRVSEKIARQSVIDSLKKLPNVLFAELNGIAEPFGIPNDQYFSYQWAFQPGGGIGKIQAPEAWDVTTGNSNSIIGIIDGGVDPTHPDLSGKVSGDAGYGWEGHGIHVAGIAAAKSNNTIGVAGVNWNAQILAKRVDNADDAHVYQSIVDAVNYSPNVNVLNNSYGWSDGRYSTTVRVAFAYAYKMNRVAIVAMDDHGATYPTYPAAYGQGIIAVGATDNQDNRVSWSQAGSWIDVTAPGLSIYSTYRNPDYQNLDGTSMAAPIVTGIASLLKGYCPNLANDDIEQIIRLSADDKGTPGWDQYYGTGRVNAKKALDCLSSSYALDHKSASGGSVYSNTGIYEEIFLGVSGLADGVYVVKRYEVRKFVNFGQTYFNAKIWGRGVGTNGFSPENPNCGMGYCDVVSNNNSSATLRTYVYQVWTEGGYYVGYVPTTPTNVSYNYTVLGQIPLTLTVDIVGPSSLGLKQTGTFAAEVEGGYPPYTYQWYKKLDNSSTWYTLGTNQTQQVMMVTTGFTLKVVITDANNNQAEDTHHVAYGSGDPKPVAAAANQVPAHYFLDQSYPNPFNNATKIRFGLPRDSQVRIDVYNIKGQKVDVLIDRYLTAGSYETSFNPDELPSGLYFYRITAGEFSDVKRMLLVK